MSNSKQKKVETLKKLQSGEMKLGDLINNEPWNNLESIFFRTNKLDINLDEEILKFKEKYPGRDYRIISFIGTED